MTSSTRGNPPKFASCYGRCLDIVTEMSGELGCVNKADVRGTCVAAVNPTGRIGLSLIRTNRLLQPELGARTGTRQLSTDSEILVVTGLIALAVGRAGFADAAPFACQG
jgi:hypothetical protein